MADTTPLKILLVEDDTDLRESLVDCLEFYGHVVKGVPNALSFYQAISANMFDIAIIDIGLPDQSGFEIVSHVKGNNSMGIVVLTAMGNPELRAKGYEKGADLYLVKPTECRELAAAIANLSERLNKEIKPLPLSNSPPWTLKIVDLQLITSTGMTVTITIREATFLKLLMTQSGERISRCNACQSLDFDPDDSNDRRMDSMIRRLRKKTNEVSGCDLPVQTIYGEGYVFSARATVC